MKPKLATLQVQKQVLAPLMQQSITVLLLPLAELVATVEQELQANPLLEIAEGAENSQTIAPSKRDDEIRQYLERLTKQRNDEPYNLPEEDFPEEQPVIIEVTLAEHLMRQLRIEISDEAEIKIGELIIGNLNEDGYLKISVE